MKQVFSVLMLMMLSIGTLTLAIKIQPTRAAAVIVVPDDYATIQAAINAANSGDTIYVRNGVYIENLEVGKDSLTLIGESKDAFINGTLLINADNVTVDGFKIADDVVIVSGSAMTGDELTQPIIELSGCNNTTIMGNTVEGYWVVVPVWAEGWIGGVGCLLEDGSNNVVRNNVFTSCESSIWISSESNDLVVGNDISSSGDFELELIASENISIYHNNFYVTTYGAAAVGTHAIWDNGYPSGGNYWSVYSGTDLYSGPYQNLTGSDGIADAPYIIDANNMDNYPLMNPVRRLTITATTGGTTNPPGGTIAYFQGQNVTVQATPNIGTVFDHWELDGAIGTENPTYVAMDQDHTLRAVFGKHDIAVTNVALSKTTIHAGYEVAMNVTVVNLGDFPESFDLTAVAINPLSSVHSVEGIETESISGLMPNETRILVLVWNTTGYAYGNYTVEALASTVPREVNVANNNCTGGNVYVTIPGDLNGDGKVSLEDLLLFAQAYSSQLGDPNWNPNADLAPPYGIISLTDLVTIATHYGQHYP